MLTKITPKRFSSVFMAADKIEQYHREGYIVLKQILPESTTLNLKNWAKALEELPDAPGKWMKYFEIDSYTKKRVLSRVENFLPYFVEFDSLSTDFISNLVSQLIGEPAVIYKDKINFKFSKGGAFPAHQDQPGFRTFGTTDLHTVLIPVDPNTRESGGLDIAPKVHNDKEIYQTNMDGSIRTDIEARMYWVPIDAYPGDIVIFDSYTPHRSDINRSNFCRRNIYLTYNPISFGFFQDKYFSMKRKVFPPDCEREEGVDYSEGAKEFNIANPIR